MSVYIADTGPPILKMLLFAIWLAIWNGQALNAPERAIFEAEVLGNRIELTLTDEPRAKLRRKGKLLIVPRRGIASDAVKAVEATRRERI
jgi:hypothetical protein